MNRRERRKLKATQPKQNKIKQLQAINQRLVTELTHMVEVHNSQARVIQEMQRQGKIVVKTDDQLPSNDVYLPLGLAEQREQNAFDAGYYHAAQVLSGVTHSIDGLRELTFGINRIALCGNNPETRATMQATLSEFLAALDNLDTEIGKLAGHPLLEIHRDDIATSVNQLKELRQLAKNFVTQQTVAAQDVLREYVRVNGSIAIQNLYQEITKVAKRGANASKAKSLIGRLAARYPDPGRGKMYTIGLNILDELRGVNPHLRSQDQKDAIYKLESLSDPDNWRNMGIYISEARKANMSIESANELFRLDHATIGD